MFYEKMKSEDRILRIEDIGRFPGEFCHLKPKIFTAETLVKSVQDLYTRFYDWKSILHRLPIPVTQAIIASWITNLSHRSLGKHNNNFDAY